MDEIININLICSNGSKSSVRLSTVGLKVAEFKDLMAQTFNLPVEEELITLIHRGIIWQDDRTLDSYGVLADHTVHVVHDPTLPLIKGIVDSNPQFVEFSILLQDPQKHNNVDRSAVAELIWEATDKLDPEDKVELRYQLHECMYEGLLHQLLQKQLVPREYLGSTC